MLKNEIFRHSYQPQQGRDCVCFILTLEFMHVVFPTVNVHFFLFHLISSYCISFRLHSYDEHSVLTELPAAVPFVMHCNHRPTTQKTDELEPQQIILIITELMDDLMKEHQGLSK